MSNRKFFSGLPPTMMTRPKTGPNRQQTNFYWPEEANSNQVSSRNRMRNRSLSTASIISQSQASTDTEESRKRRSNDNRSRIEFYDMVDTTDTESVYDRKLDPTTHKKLEGLKSRIHFYDYKDSSQAVQNMENDDANSVIEVERNENKKEEIKNIPVDQDIAKSMNSLSLNNHNKKPPAPPQRSQKQQVYPDSYGSDSEDEAFRYQKSFRNQERFYRRPPLPQPQQRPRRYHSHFFDDFEDDGYERYYDSNRKPRLPRTNRTRRDFSPDDISDEEFYDDRSYARRNMRDYRNKYSPDRGEFRSNTSRYGDYEDRAMSNARLNGHANDIETTDSRLKAQLQQPLENESDVRNSRPPVQRTMSVNEARRRHHVNLKSNIFHNDNEYEQVVVQRKPLSVRDFAANHRVGVGLPDLI